MEIIKKIFSSPVFNFISEYFWKKKKSHMLIANKSQVFTPRYTIQLIDISWLTEYSL